MDVISALDGYDQSDDPISALADQIADRLAVKLAARLTESAAKAESDPRGLWTARQVAAHYDIGVRFVYEHADELGCVRLGGGPRPRLRFDPRIVRERWSLVGDTLPTPVLTRRRARSKTTGHSSGGRRTYELLDFDEEP